MEEPGDREVRGSGAALTLSRLAALKPSRVLSLSRSRALTLSRSPGFSKPLPGIRDAVAGECKNAGNAVTSRDQATSFIALRASSRS